MNSRLTLSILVLILTSCNLKTEQDPNKSLPNGELQKGDWFIGSRMLHDNYGAYTQFSFSGTDSEGEVYIYEDRSDDYPSLGSKAKSCQSSGTYKYDSKAGALLINLNRYNSRDCPWVGKINGSFKYQFVGNKYFIFTDGNISITKVANKEIN